MTTPGAPSTARAQGDDSLVVVGWIAVFLFPLAAIVVGILLRSRGDGRGTPILVVSSVTTLIALVAMIAILRSIDDPSGASGTSACTFDHRPTAAERHDCFKALGRGLRP